MWNRLVAEAIEQKRTSIAAPIQGSDRNSEVIKQAKTNAVNSSISEYVKFLQQDLSQATPPAEKGVIICNPPYGERIGNISELEELYKMLGDVFKQRFTGWTAYILTGSKHLSKKVGLRTAKRVPVYNGSIPCTLLKYELY